MKSFHSTQRILIGTVSAASRRSQSNRILPSSSYAASKWCAVCAAALCSCTSAFSVTRWSHFSSDARGPSHRRSSRSHDRLFERNDDGTRINQRYTPESPTSSTSSILQTGNKIMIEVVRFGPLGASVDIIGNSHNENDIISLDDPILGHGLILQREIQYFRQARKGVDVVVGELLPAYVENLRDGDVRKYDIALRPPGGRAKATDLAGLILEQLEGSNGGVLEVGDKSSPQEINNLFPGQSKGAFKKAVSLLFKKGKVKPGPYSITLMK
mmetsp:Transcript_50225/g.60414  ORF Transcript_50225/g.60414 Transcript_50225/m.60414 type:complete len:270 (-) Transcript_50225:365-1174(-)